MRKFVIVFAFFMICGCAAKQPAYVIPDHVKSRPHVLIHKRLVGCMGMTYDAAKYRLYINASKEPNAMARGDGSVVLTEGLFKYNDETLAFIIAHELAHVKLDHVPKKQAASYATTGIMMVVGVLVPGAGYLNHLVNPAVVNNYSKLQEYDADKLAWETCQKCFKFDEAFKRRIIDTMTADATGSGGGFWSTHPSWEDRVKNLSP